VGELIHLTNGKQFIDKIIRVYCTVFSYEVCPSCLPCRDVIIIHRLRIGHTSYAWTLNSKGGSPWVLGLSSGFDC